MALLLTRYALRCKSDFFQGSPTHSGSKLIVTGTHGGDGEKEQDGRDLGVGRVRGGLRKC